MTAATAGMRKTLVRIFRILLLVAFSQTTYAATVEHKLLRSGAGNTDAYGFSVAIDGKVAVVGAISQNRDDPGAVHVFHYNGVVWDERAKLTANDGEDGDLFGHAVDIDGDLIVVAAPNHDIGPIEDAGAVYVYRRSGASWIQDAKLIDENIGEFHSFGDSVAIDQNTIVVGDVGNGTFGFGAGAVHVFKNIGGQWLRRTTLFSGTPVSGEQFGNSVALNGRVLVVGAWLSSAGDLGSQVGAAYVFRGRGAMWRQTDVLSPSDGEFFDLFGISVAVSGPIIVVGAPGDFGPAGSAYVYRWGNGTWTERAILTASDGQALDRFGTSVATTGRVIVVGTPMDIDFLDEEVGRAYLFRWNGTTWTEREILTASDIPAQGEFGFDVDIDSNRIISGAWRAFFDGAAYVYQPE